MKSQNKFASTKNKLIYLSPASSFEIKKLLASLQLKSSSGIDEIRTTVLKTTPDNVQG